MADSFWAPHAYIPGQFSFRRVRAEGHPVFDVALAITPDGTHHAYVNSALGEHALAQHPRLEVHRVAPAGLRMQFEADGLVVAVQLEADLGPVRTADLRFVAPQNVLPRLRHVPGDPWGGTKHLSRTELGVDGVADGRIGGAQKKSMRELANVPCVLTLGAHVSKAAT